jgi:hypothetical protein
MVRKYMDDGFENWEEVLGPMASAYRNSVHSSTMEIPYFLITARDPSMVIYRFLIPEKELITPQDYKSQTMKRQREGFNLVKRNLLDARRQQKIQYDRRAKEEKFEIGDRVLLDVRKTKLGTSKKLIPGIKDLSAFRKSSLITRQKSKRIMGTGRSSRVSIV